MTPEQDLAELLARPKARETLLAWLAAVRAGPRRFQKAVAEALRDGPGPRVPGPPSQVNREPERYLP